LDERGTVFVRIQTRLGTRAAIYLRKRVNFICNQIRLLPKLCKKGLPGALTIKQATMSTIGSRRGTWQEKGRPKAPMGASPKKNK